MPAAQSAHLWLFCLWCIEHFLCLGIVPPFVCHRPLSSCTTVMVFVSMIWRSQQAPSQIHQNGCMPLGLQGGHIAPLCVRRKSCGQGLVLCRHLGSSGGSKQASLCHPGALASHTLSTKKSNTGSSAKAWSAYIAAACLPLYLRSLGNSAMLCRG